MERIQERLMRIREMATRVEEAALAGNWHSAVARAVALNNHAAFLVDWLRGQAEYPYSAAEAAGADAWEPIAEPALGNVSEPLSNTLDADLVAVLD